MDTEPLAGDQEGFMWWEAGLETVRRVDVNVRWVCIQQKTLPGCGCPQSSGLLVGSSVLGQGE